MRGEATLSAAKRGQASGGGCPNIASPGRIEDVEVGLQYFGKRFLNPLLGRWVSADPLAVHAPGEADSNVYAYVRGAVLKAIDPIGLQDAIGVQEAGYDRETATEVDLPDPAHLVYPDQYVGGEYIGGELFMEPMRISGNAPINAPSGEQRTQALKNSVQDTAVGMVEDGVKSLAKEAVTEDLQRPCVGADAAEETETERPFANSAKLGMAHETLSRFENAEEPAPDWLRAATLGLVSEQLASLDGHESIEIVPLSA